ncbi:MAG: hypothetical protein WC294_11100 [Methanoregula sp.]|jgi:hypothetical protein
MIATEEFIELLKIAEKEAEGATLFIGGVEVDYRSHESVNLILYREKREFVSEAKRYISSFIKFGAVDLERKRFEKR